MDYGNTRIRPWFMIDPSLLANYYAFVEIIKYIKESGKKGDIIFPFTLINRFRTDSDTLLQRLILPFLDINKTLFDNLLHITKDYYLINFDSLIKEIQKSMILAVSEIEHIPVYERYRNLIRKKEFATLLKHLVQYLVDIFYDIWVINGISEVIFEELNFLVMGNSNNSATNEKRRIKDQKILPLILAFSPRNILIFEEIGIPIIHYRILREVFYIKKKYDEKNYWELTKKKNPDISYKIHSNFIGYVCKLFKDYLDKYKKEKNKARKKNECIFDIIKFIHTLLKNLTISNKFRKVLTSLNLTRISNNFVVILPIRYHDIEVKSIESNEAQKFHDPLYSFLFILISLKDFLQIINTNGNKLNTNSDQL